CRGGRPNICDYAVDYGVYGNFAIALCDRRSERKYRSFAESVAIRIGHWQVEESRRDQSRSRKSISDCDRGDAVFTVDAEFDGIDHRRRRQMRRGEIRQWNSVAMANRI